MKKYIVSGLLFLLALGYTLGENAPAVATVFAVAGLVFLPAFRQRFPVWSRALVLVSCVVVFYVVEKKAETPAAPLSEAQQRQQDSLAVIAAANHKIADDVEYSYIKADRAIKRILKDPDSYERIEHRAGHVGKDGVYVACLVTYRAKNSFGGFAVEKAVVTFNDKMEPLDVQPAE